MYLYWQQCFRSQENEKNDAADSHSRSSLLHEDLSDGDGSPGFPVSPPASKRGRCFSIFVQIGLLFATAMIFFFLGWTSQTPSPTFSSSWEKLNNVIQYKPKTFNPRFISAPSEYQGKPSPELDAKWNGISALRNYAVDESTLIRANKTKANVQYPGTSTYQAGLEAFHQLHCLNFIRMYTERSYYKNVDYDMIEETDDESRDHKDHCVEILRQRLMCMPDLQVYTYHWASQGELPMADLRTNHQCIDWDMFYDWAEKNAVHSPVLRRPEGSEVLTEEDIRET